MGEVVQSEAFSKKIGWVSFGLIGLGFVASLAIAASYLLSQKPEPAAVAASAEERPEDAAEQPAEEEVHYVAELPAFCPDHFEQMQHRIDAATEDEARFEAVLDSSVYLLRIVPRRTRARRRAMAEEYLLALAEKPLSQIQQNRLAGLLYEVAVQTKSPRFFEKADAARELSADSSSLQTACLRLDALRELGRFSDAVAFFDQLTEQTHAAEDEAWVLLQDARFFDFALRDAEALLAGSGQPTLDSDEELRKLVCTRLAHIAGKLRTDADPERRTEGLFYSARVAREQGETAAEAAYLRQVLMRGDGWLRLPAAKRLAEILRNDTPLDAYAELLTQWLDWDGGRAALEAEWLTFFSQERSVRYLDLVLGVIDAYTADEQKSVCPKVLLAIARTVDRLGLLHMAEKYLEVIEERTLDPRLLEEALVLQCQVAEKQGDGQTLRARQMKLIAIYPGHPLEADIRFSLFQQKVEAPTAELDILHAAVGAALRLPLDPRSMQALLTVARRFEEKTLYDLAAFYYRRASLLGALQDSNEASGAITEALLGQARVMAAWGKTTEAESVLRSMHTGVRHIHVWDESGPLWASLAFVQGQSREGVRRWRQVCSAPTGEILPFVFSRLLPDREEWTVRVAARPGAGRTLSPEVTPVIMERFVRGALETFLNDGDLESAGELLIRVGQDPLWKDRLPLNQYSSQFIDKLAQQKNLDLLLSWMEQLDVLSEQEGEATWGEWFQFVGDFSDKTRPFHLKGENL